MLWSLYMVSNVQSQTESLSRVLTVQCLVLKAAPTYCLALLGETERQAEGKNLMCCFLPVHSWHSQLPFSFFDCDFFFSLALIVKPRVHSQPSPTAPVWLSHRKLGFLYSLLYLSHSLYTVCSPVSFFLYVSLCHHILYTSLYFLFYCLCVSVLVSIPNCLIFDSISCLVFV